jgi:hypothetical protein
MADPVLISDPGRIRRGLASAGRNAGDGEKREE